MSLRPIKPATYYDYMPVTQQSCGDIWSGLPTMGLLGKAKDTVGIMITPACDLANYKTETLTFLPVISIGKYLSSPAWLPTLRTEIMQRYEVAKIAWSINWPTPGYEPPRTGAIEAEIVRLNAELIKEALDKKKREQIERAIAGLNLAANCANDNSDRANLTSAATLFGANWDKIKRKLITNSYSQDIHFLPGDGRKDIHIGIREHSVVLLRYPITILTEYLNHAASMSESTWRSFINESGSQAAKYFDGPPPVKSLSLKKEFLVDLLSRFNALYGRVGSPDLSTRSIDKIIKEIL